jgi:hypothetical protein
VQTQPAFERDRRRAFFCVINLFPRVLVQPPSIKGNGTGMRNDRLFQAAVIAAGVASVGAVAALVFIFQF